MFEAFDEIDIGTKIGVSVPISVIFWVGGLWILYKTKWSHVTIDFNIRQVRYTQAPFVLVYCASEKCAPLGEITWHVELAGLGADRDSDSTIFKYYIIMHANTEEIVVETVDDDCSQDEPTRIMEGYKAWFNSNIGLNNWEPNYGTL